VLLTPLQRPDELPELQLAIADGDLAPAGIAAEVDLRLTVVDCQRRLHALWDGGDRVVSFQSVQAPTGPLQLGIFLPGEGEGVIAAGERERSSLQGRHRSRLQEAREPLILVVERGVAAHLRARELLDVEF